MSADTPIRPTFHHFNLKTTRLQELIGYSIHPPFMGMIDGRHPKKLLT